MQTTDWIGTTGDWFDPANWSAGVPTATTAARVLTEATIQINGGTAVAKAVTLNSAQAATVQQTGGDLMLTTLTLRGVGSYRLSGGTQAADDVGLYPGTRYELAGGTLRISKMLSRVDFGTAASTLDFTGGGSLDVAGGIADLNGLTMSAPGQGHVAVQPDALLVVPAGFDPATGFASFSNAGLVHNVGSTLTVPAGTAIEFNASLTDPVIVHGTYKPYSIQKGVQVHAGGAAATAGGPVVVEDTTSGVFGGDLQVPLGGLSVTGNQAAKFTLTSGRVSGGTLRVASHSASAVATFHMTGGTLEGFGFVDIGTTQGKGAFIQDGGTATGLGNLRIEQGSSYTLNGGSVSGSFLMLDVGGIFGPGAFTQNGGTLTGNRLTVRKGSTFTLNDGSATFVTLQHSEGKLIQKAGSLTARDASIGAGGQVAELVIDGGTHTTMRNMNINGQSSLTYAGGTVSLGVLVLLGGSKLEFGIDDDDLLDPIEITTSDSSLGGTLAVKLLDGFTELGAADQIVLLDAPSSLQGSFMNVANDARLDTNGGSFRVNYGSASPFGADKLVISDFQPVPEPATAAIVLIGGAIATCLRRRRGGA